MTGEKCKVNVGICFPQLLAAPGSSSRCAKSLVRPVPEFGALYNGAATTSYSLIPSPFFLILRKEFTIKPLSDGLSFLDESKVVGTSRVGPVFVHRQFDQR